MTTPTEADRGTVVLVVATWYPGVDDPGRGRFVADQAEALLVHGGVRPLVASFEVAYVRDAPDARRAGSITAHLRAAIESRDDVVSPVAWPGTAPIAVARLPTPEPYGRSQLPPGEEADRRREALEALVGRLDTGRMRGVVHAHTAYPDGYAALGAARALGWPLVVTEHASFVSRQLRQPEQRRRYLEAARAASTFVAVSEMLASELRAAIPEIAGKLVVIPNVIPIDSFEAAGREGRTPDELLFIGNRKERKGMVVLLRAFADVLERRPTATLRLIGKATTAEEEARWHSLADDLGIASAVRFEPPIDRTGIAEALRRASVFVHASPRETFGVVTLEALASGLPVVATESGGISGILEDRRLGELVPPHDARMLARAVLRTLDRIDEFDPQVLRAAVEPFSGSSVAPRLRAVYDEALARDGGVTAGSTPQSPVAGRALGWSGHSTPLPPSTVVLAHDTGRAAQMLSGMPAELLTRLTVITHGGLGGPGLPVGIGRVILSGAHANDQLRRRGLHGPRRGMRDRVLRLLANPIAPIRRRLAKGGLAEVRWQATVAGITRALAELDPHAQREAAPEVLCVDAIDYAAAAPLVAAGRLRATPGGLVWLGDRWAATQGRAAESIAAPTELGSVESAVPTG